MYGGPIGGVWGLACLSPSMCLSVHLCPCPIPPLTMPEPEHVPECAPVPVPQPGPEAMWVPETRTKQHALYPPLIMPETRTKQHFVAPYTSYRAYTPPTYHETRTKQHSVARTQAPYNIEAVMKREPGLKQQASCIEV